MPRYLLGAVTLALMCLGHAPATAGSNYTIYVAVPEATFLDYLALTDWCLGAAATDPVPESIAAPGAAAIAEVAAAAALRVDASGVLRLDDGALVVLADGDELHVGAYVADNPVGTQRVTPVVVIVKGQGVAKMVGRDDLSAPSGI